jgi:hypothetical protein
MNITAERKAINEALDIYRNELDAIPDALFTQTPPGGGWSYAEVYSHILMSDLGSLIAMERCCRNTGIVSTKGVTWLGKLVFLIGRFPPFRFSSPDNIASLAKKITKEEARNLIIRLRKRMDEVIPMTNNALNYSKINHPRLGMLNAKQWFKFIRIHTQHHLKQLQRINRYFSK